MDAQKASFRDRYIISLEEQIEMHKNQNTLHQAQIAKLNERVRSLEAQIAAESKKRKLNPGLPADNLTVMTSNDSIHSSRPVIFRASLSTPNSPSDSRVMYELPSPLPSLNVMGRTLPPFMHTQRLSQPSSPASRAASQSSYSPPLNFLNPKHGPETLHFKQPHSHSGQVMKEKSSSEILEEETYAGPACNGCRIRKRKCTREKPECSYCVKLNKNKSDPIPCSYPDPNNKTMTLTEKRLRAINEARSANSTPFTTAPSSAATSPTSRNNFTHQYPIQNGAGRTPPDSAPISRVVSPQLKNSYPSTSPTQRQLEDVSSSLFKLATTSLN